MKTLILVLQKASETSESEYEEESEASSTESSEEIKAPPTGPPQFVQKLIVFAAGLRLLLSTVMNTAGKVVVTVLLGISGNTHKHYYTIFTCSCICIRFQHECGFFENL